MSQLDVYNALRNGLTLAQRDELAAEITSLVHAAKCYGMAIADDSKSTEECVKQLQRAQDACSNLRAYGLRVAEF